MTYSFDRYNVERAGLNIAVSIKDGLYPGSQIQQFTAQFAKGNQVKVSHKTEHTKQQVFSTPATAFDWLKKLVCDWQPDLCFGWLIPEMKVATVNIETHHHSKYWNVMPAPMDARRHDVFRIANHYDVSAEISPHDWLEIQPPTHDDINAARDEYHRVLSSDDAAWFMRW